MKVCWNITSSCNKNCPYCFKFTEKDLTLEQNKIILSKLPNLGVDKILWAGGEPFLYKDLNKLLKLSKEQGLINYLNTNASLLTESNVLEKTKYVDRLIISLDFVDDKLNERYKIGKNYYYHVQKILNKLKETNLEIQINTVLFSKNIDFIDDLYKELGKYNIKYWKILQYFPIRGKALKEKTNLSITDDEFEKCVSKYKKEKNKFELIVHNIKKMEERHIIILSSGKIIYSENGKDVQIDKELIKNE